MSDDIRSILKKIKADSEWQKINLDNPLCAGWCNWRVHPDHLFVSKTGRGLLCAECADDEVQKITGCRWGKPDTCNSIDHEDCHLPLLHD